MHSIRCTQIKDIDINMEKNELVALTKDFALHIAAAYRSIDVWESILKEAQEYPEVFGFSCHFFKAVTAIAASSSIVETDKLFDNDTKAYSINDLFNDCNRYDPSLRPIIKGYKDKLKSHNKLKEAIHAVRIKVMAHADKDCFTYDEINQFFDKHPFTLKDIKGLLEICEQACNAILSEICQEAVCCHDLWINDLHHMADLANRQWQSQRHCK